VIFRQAAIGARKPGSIAEATKVVRSELTKLGIWDPGMTINDGSGLSRQTKVPADSMVKMLRAAAASSTRTSSRDHRFVRSPASRAACGASTSTTRAWPDAVWYAARPAR
jgi:D-alanyl-D-alanine carboxypeptidase